MSNRVVSEERLQVPLDYPRDGAARCGDIMIYSARTSRTQATDQNVLNAPTLWFALLSLEASLCIVGQVTHVGVWHACVEQRSGSICVSGGGMSSGAHRRWPCFG